MDDWICLRVFLLQYAAAELSFESRLSDINFASLSLSCPVVQSRAFSCLNWLFVRGQKLRSYIL